jgi:hypothetical protein
MDASVIHFSYCLDEIFLVETELQRGVNILSNATSNAITEDFIERPVRTVVEKLLHRSKRAHRTWGHQVNGPLSQLLAHALMMPSF